MTPEQWIGRLNERICKMKYKLAFLATLVMVLAIGNVSQHRVLRMKPGQLAYAVCEHEDTQIVSYDWRGNKVVKCVPGKSGSDINNLNAPDLVIEYLHGTRQVLVITCQQGSLLELPFGNSGRVNAYYCKED